jgi:hypothetical protein
LLICLTLFGSYAESLRGSRGGKAGRVYAQVAEEPASGERGHDEESDEEAGLGEPVVPRQFDQEDEDTQGDHDERDDAVEAAGLGVRPGVERPTISRPWSESVQRGLLGQALQTCARAR